MAFSDNPTPWRDQAVAYFQAVVVYTEVNTVVMRVVRVTAVVQLQDGANVTIVVVLSSLEGGWSLVCGGSLV